MVSGGDGRGVGCGWRSSDLGLVGIFGRDDGEAL